MGYFSIGSFFKKDTFPLTGRVIDCNGEGGRLEGPGVFYPVLFLEKGTFPSTGGVIRQKREGGGLEGYFILSSFLNQRMVRSSPSARETLGFHPSVFMDREGSRLMTKTSQGLWGPRTGFLG